MKKIMRTVLWSSFLIYCAALIFVLFYTMRIRSDHIPLSLYLRLHTNFIQFDSIAGYIQLLYDNAINSSTAIRNLLGNLILFFPMGIYLPCIFTKLRSFIKSMAVVFTLIFIAEIIQVTLEIGSFDIDDLILNISGAAAAYGLWSVRPIRRFLGKLYLVRD